MDEIKRSAIKYQDRSIPQAGPEGCVVIPTVMYLDSCYSPKFSVMHTETPRANFLHEKEMREIFYLDMEKHDGCELSDYKFGKVGWKGRNQIAYSYRLPVEQLYIDHNVHSAARSSDFESVPEPLATAQHELVVTQPTAAKSVFDPQPASNSGGSTSVSVVDEIGQLLQKVEDLSHNIPSTADRMSRIAGLFPTSHGPSADAVEEQTQHETKLLDSMRLALSYMRTGFAVFVKKQDLVCREYEREAVVIERQIMEQHVDADTGGWPDEAGFFRWYRFRSISSGCMKLLLAMMIQWARKMSAVI